jgi:DNA-binding SARP family transcriptional activator
MDLRLLGPVEAWVDGESLALGGPTRRAVFAALLLKADKALPSGPLVHAVWEEPPASSHSNIRTHIAGLRRVFRDAGQEDRLSSSGSAYRLIVEPGELDVVRFSDLAGQGKQAFSDGDFETASRHFGDALEQWRGPALNGATLGHMLQAEAARLEEQRLAVVEQGVDVDLALGRHDELVVRLRALVVEHPMRERFWAQLMLALYRVDRQADALAAYEQLRSYLADELGLDPGPELQRLHAQILRAEPALLEAAFSVRGETELSAARVVPPRHLPPTSATFTGRDKELADIKAFLQSTGQRSVVISAIDGTGGIGKSALAVKAASELAEHFPDG